MGKKTFAASDPVSCYGWLFRYFNAAVPGESTPGTNPGYHAFEKAPGLEFVEPSDAPPNALALEANECGTTAGNLEVNITTVESLQRGVANPPMSPKDVELVGEGLRLPVGEMHQCPCAVQGRSHIVNGSLASESTLMNFSAMTASWGEDFVRIVSEYADRERAELDYVLSPEEQRVHSLSKYFGLHAVYCPYHESGPCTLRHVERGVARSWAQNFSAGYTPLMDNNLMLWATTLRPLLDAFQRDGVPFYPMKWNASGAQTEVYSVLVSPCGKILIELAAMETGRGPEQFHPMAHARATFESGKWNEPTNPVWPPALNQQPGPSTTTAAIMCPNLTLISCRYGSPSCRCGSPAP